MNAADQSPEEAKDVVTFRGHPLVMSSHPTTIEITTEEHLSEDGDCIIGVGASKGCAQLDPRVKEGLRDGRATVKIRILVGDLAYEVAAFGDPRLGLSHPHDMVVRKSDFVSDRTLAVRASAASKDIPRPMVRLLRDPGTVGRMEVVVTR